MNALMDDAGVGDGGGGGFGYSGQSLDQLRTLSGSVDNGRIGEMQSHFASVAEQVDDVVSQLIALKKDLPNWWTGEAADTAIASFDRVISHAQSTHQVAAGAAHALKICSAVIGEQQSAMAAVPEVDEPAGMPLTRQPFQSGTAESAIIEQSQAARYEAARAKAVGVVDGLAAQFVETRAQLADLVDHRLSAQIDYKDQSFQPIQLTSSPKAHVTQPFNMPVPVMAESEPLSIQRRPHVFEAENIPYIASTLGALSTPRRPLDVTSNQTNMTSGQDSRRSDEKASYSRYVEEHFLAAQDAPSEALVTNGYTSTNRPSEPPHESRFKPTRQEIPIMPNQGEINSNLRRYTQSSSYYSSNDNHHSPNYRNHEYIKEEVYGTENDRDIPATTSTREIQSSHDTSELPQNEGLIQPFMPSTGSSRSEKQSRGKRPSYLVANSDEWLQHRPAAPADGVLTPDWAEGE